MKTKIEKLLVNRNLCSVLLLIVFCFQIGCGQSSCPTEGNFSGTDTASGVKMDVHFSSGARGEESDVCYLSSPSVKLTAPSGKIYAGSVFSASDSEEIIALFPSFSSISTTDTNIVTLDAVEREGYVEVHKDSANNDVLMTVTISLTHD